MHHIHQAEYMSFLVQLVVAQFLGFPLIGIVLGGSPAINGGFYSRASEEFVCKKWGSYIFALNQIETIDILQNYTNYQIFSIDSKVTLITKIPNLKKKTHYLSNI